MTQKKNFKYKYYSCLDSKLLSPQPEQHLLCNRKAIKENGQIVFYGAEEFSVLEYQPYILEKIKRTKEIDGVIFFTLNQFCYLDKFNLDLLERLLVLKKTIHFAREDMSIYNYEDLKSYLPMLVSYQNSFSRRKEIANNILRLIK